MKLQRTVRVLHGAPFAIVYLFADRAVLARDAGRWTQWRTVGPGETYPLGGLADYCYLAGLLPEFRSLAYARMRRTTAGKLLARVMSLVYRGATSLSIRANPIGQGLVLEHGFGSILGHSSIGADCTIHHNVTLGTEAGGPAIEIGSTSVPEQWSYGERPSAMTRLSERTPSLSTTSRQELLWLGLPLGSSPEKRPDEPDHRPGISGLPVTLTSDMPESSRQHECIWTLGNDGVADWLIALFQSIRDWDGPDRVVRLIPFDNRMARTAEICLRYGVEIWNEPVLEELEAIGLRLKPQSASAARTHRKLATLLDREERFLFIDADAVLVSPSAPFFRAIARFGNGIVFLDEDTHEVYKEGPLLARLHGMGRARGFNSGVFGGQRTGVSLAEIVRRADEVGPSNPQLVSNQEQSFLNYVVHSSSAPLAAFGELDRSIGGSWAGLRVNRRRDYEINDARWKHPTTARSTLRLIHWAGFGLEPTMPHRGRYRRYRLGGEPSLLAQAAFELAQTMQLAKNPALAKWIITNIPRRTLARIRRSPRLAKWLTR